MKLTRYLQKWIRLFHVLKILKSYKIIRLILSIEKLPKTLKILLFFYDPYGYSKKYSFSDSYCNDLCRACEKLGPLFIKLGQILSTRKDLFPIKLTTSLSKLQDKTLPFESKIIIEIVEKELNSNISNIFKHFSTVPIASASIAQVHEAILHNEERVVVKIVKPYTKNIIINDSNILITFAKIVKYLFPQYKNLRFLEIILEIRKNLLL